LGADPLPLDDASLPLLPPEPELLLPSMPESPLPSIPESPLASMPESLLPLEPLDPLLLPDVVTPQAPVGWSRPRKETTSPYRGGLTVSRSCIWVVGPRFVCSLTCPAASSYTVRVHPVRPLAGIPEPRFPSV
jgi:hypothetical protein